MKFVRILSFVFVLALLGLGFAATPSVSVSLTSPDQDVHIYENRTFNATLNVSCYSADCGNVNVTLLHARSSSFIMSSDTLTLTDRQCILHHPNDDMDSTILWTDLTARVNTQNDYTTNSPNYMTWDTVTENLTTDYLPGRPGGLGDSARPVPLVGVNKTVWFDWQNNQVVWDGGSASFGDLGLVPSIVDFSISGDGNSFYVITDGISRIHVGKPGGSMGAKVLTFDFVHNTVSVDSATVFNPINGWHDTEEDDFGHILYTVNNRVFYFDHYAGGTGYFALGGDLSDPNSQYDLYPTTGWGDPSQPGLDFFAAVDSDGYLWFGDWGHDNGGYFNCGNDEYFGVAKSNIRFSGLSNVNTSNYVSTVSGDIPFTTISNPQVVSLNDSESILVNYTVNATEPGFNQLYGFAIVDSSPDANSTSDFRIIHTYQDIPPTVSLSPQPNYFMHPGDLIANFSCGEGIFGNISLWSNVGGSWSELFSNTSYSESSTQSYDFGNLSYGFYTWAVKCDATNGKSTWSSNHTINVTDSGLFECQEINTPGYVPLLMDLSSPSDNCISITSDNVTLDCRGHSINGSSTDYNGIYISGYNNIVIKNCAFSQFDNGIYSEYNENFTAINNTASGNNVGIYTYYTSRASVSSNNLSNDNDEGLYSNYDSNLSVYYNTLDHSNDGIYMDSSDDSKVYHNNMTGNDYSFIIYYGSNNQFGYNNIIDTAYFSFSSCPFLFTWDGVNHNFITDVSGSGILGIPRENTYRKPTPADYVKVNSNQLKDENGLYNITLSEEYDEISYFDDLALYTVDHSNNVDVAAGLAKSNVGTFYTYSKDLTPVVSCVDQNGDCTSKVSSIDNVFAENGQAGEESMVVNLGDMSTAPQIKLLLDGYSIFGNGSVKSIQVRAVNGSWVDAFPSQLGSPSGFPRMYIINMTGKFPTSDYSVNLTFSAGHFDFVGVDTSLEAPLQVNRYNATSADLHYRGYSRQDGNLSFYYDNPDNSSGYSSPVGNFTRYGDVLSLVTGLDDQYVVMHHGDEISASFPYVAASENLSRDFFVYTYDYFKRAKDIHGSSVGPMPFKNMSNYPYSPSEHYPTDVTHNNYQSSYNTREYTHYMPPQTAIAMPYSFNTSVFNNYINGTVDSTGLYVLSEDASNIYNNYIENVDMGIHLDSSTNVNVYGNMINALSESALYLYSSSGASVYNNILATSSNDPGAGPIEVSQSSNNNFINNTLISYNSSVPAVRLFSDTSDNNLFLQNYFDSDLWVFDENTNPSNSFSDSDIGNAYYLFNGTAAWEIYNISSSTNGTWADEGSDLPFNSSLLGGQWIGGGHAYDQHPMVNATLSLPILLDTDQDGIPDYIDPLLYNATNVSSSGVSDLEVTVDNSSTNMPFSGVREIEILDNGTQLVTFDYDFDNGTLDLSRVSVTRGSNYVIVNLSGQLQTDLFNKSVFLVDRGYNHLCAKDSEIASVSQISSTCNEADETDLSSCIGGSYNAPNGISCVDHGSIIEVRNLVHSGLMGSLAPAAPSEQSSNPTRRFSVSLGMQCTNNTITTSTDSVSINVIDDSSGASIFSGTTDSSGHALFSACGQNAHIYASKDGYAPIDSVYTLNDCTCAGPIVTNDTTTSAPLPPVVAPTPTNTTVPTPVVNTTTPAPTTNATAPVVPPTSNPVAPVFNGPSSGQVGSSATFTVSNCDDCSISATSPDGRVIVLPVQNGQVSLPLSVAGQYSLALVRNGEVLQNLSVSATAPAPAPAEPVQQPTPSDNGFGFWLMIILLIIILGGAAYYLMNQKSRK